MMGWLTAVEATGITILSIWSCAWAWARSKQKQEQKARLLDPDYAFPNLGPRDAPHDFKGYEDGPAICVYCGGGKKHQIHTGGPWPLPLDPVHRVSQPEPAPPEMGSEF